MLLDDVMNMAFRAGADHADAVHSQQYKTEVRYRDGAVEKTGRSDSSSLAMRIFIGKKTASFSASQFEKNSLNSLIDEVIAIARAAPDDESAMLARPEQLYQRSDVNLETFDTQVYGVEKLLQSTDEMERATLSLKAIQQASNVFAAAGGSTTTIRTSNGFSGSIRSTRFNRFCGAIAADVNGKATDSKYSEAVFFEDLEDSTAIGLEAAQNAARKLSSGRVRNGSHPVIFDARCANSLVGSLAAAISGPSIVRGTSFLKTKMGEQILPGGVNIVDNPHIRRGLASRLFDWEGVECNPINFVDDGHLVAWATNVSSARDLGVAASGHGGFLGRGVDFTNLYMTAGDCTREELMADIEYGVYVTEFLGHGVNLVTGQYSQAVSGFLIENGEITRPIKETTIAGSLSEMYRNIVPANDLTFTQRVNAPSVRIDCMIVAGE